MYCSWTDVDYDHPAIAGWQMPNIQEILKEAREEPPPHGRSYGRLGAVAVAVGLVVGGLAFAYWRHSQAKEVEPPVVATTLAVAPASEPEARMPTTVAELDHLFDTARAWVRMMPQAEDRDLARFVWAVQWSDVPFPPWWDPEARPSDIEALALVDRAIALAREQMPATKAAASAAAAPVITASSSAPDKPRESTMLVREAPTPGYFYAARRGDAMLGDDGVAARALREGVMIAARRKGWSSAEADARAKRLSAKPSAQTAYAELIQRSAWNPDVEDALVEGTLLWLPPVRASRLLEHDRRRQVVLDARPWPDGSSRLEPPVSQLGTPTPDIGLRSTEFLTSMVPTPRTGSREPFTPIFEFTPLS